MNAQYTAAVTNPEYVSLLHLEIPSFTLRATALNCGVYDYDGVKSGRMSCVLEGDISAETVLWSFSQGKE